MSGRRKKPDAPPGDQEQSVSPEFDKFREALRHIVKVPKEAIKLDGSKRPKKRRE